MHSTHEAWVHFVWRCLIATNPLDFKFTNLVKLKFSEDLESHSI